ncbi:MAG TPA: UbiX family flavin prenyltransferase [Nocardioidaceae bacterium]|nr:UbiX family flavin prenyltransferase [Nocardioidaceae bacterium]
MIVRRGRRCPWVVAVTGASGTPYAARLLRALLDAGEDVDLMISKAARLTILDETGVRVRDGRWRQDVADWVGRDVDPVVYWSPTDFAAGPSSGSYRTRGMVVAPATTAAISGIAVGASKDLIQRAADVTLKERRPLVLLVRETPLRAVTLEQMATLAREGATIMPASPAFYAGAKSIDDLVDFVVGRLLDQLDVEHELFERWNGSPPGVTEEAEAD